MTFHKVAVLLAAYNGEHYLNAQISSILVQQDVNVTLYVSLDESSDNSLEIIKGYVENNSNVYLLKHGARFGSAGKNFFHLINSVELSAFDFVAFADQDDIWHQDKLFNAIEKLQQYDCYSSNVTAFWEDGREVLIDKAQPQPRWDYLFEAAGPGCTYVLKREFGLIFQSWLINNYATIENNVALHDWLIYAFARHNGYRWYIDPNPSMRYRQHQNNQVGTNNNLVAAKKRLRLINDKWYRNQIISIATILGLEDTPVVKRGLMKGYFGNLYLLTNLNKLRRRTRDKFALAVVLLLNIF